MRPIDADALIEVVEKSMAENPHKEKTQRAMHIHEHKYFLTLLAGTPTIQPVATDTNVGDKISKFIDGLEEIFADIRERHVDDSVCGLCEYDGAYMGQSGDWCNECPGFEKDDCFKLSDKTRKKWTDEIIKALPPAQPEPQWIPVSERLPEVHESGNSVSGIYMQSNPVLVYGTCEYEDNAQFHVVTYCDDLDGNTYWSTEPDAITVSGVLAWMPLPEAYKPNK